MVAFVRSAAPSGWTYPIRNVVVWAYTHDESAPNVDSYSACFDGLDEGRNLVQGDIPPDLVEPKPLAHLHIDRQGSAIYVPLQKAILVKYLHIKLISAYNLLRDEMPAPHIEVGYLGIAGLCVPPSGKLFEEEAAEELTFLDQQPLTIVHGFKPPSGLNVLTESFYDYAHTHRFVYLFPPMAWVNVQPSPLLSSSLTCASAHTWRCGQTSNPLATPFEDLKAIVSKLARDEAFSSGDMDLAFFHGSAVTDAQLASWCGLWSSDPTIAFIVHVSSLHASFHSTYPSMLSPSYRICTMNYSIS